MLATWVSVDINGHRPDLSHGEAFELVMAVSQGELEVPAIAVALRLVPRPALKPLSSACITLIPGCVRGTRCAGVIPQHNVDPTLCCP